ncbi:MAG TPA: hypothetical protein VHG91_06590 [Longimicrobium sp.]|nr:hypothetical protein [Longimicrobium sp.]
MRGWKGAAALALAAAAGGCTLTDVTVAPGEDRVVVEAVMRSDAVSQQVLLHRTLDGRFAEGVPGAEVSVVDVRTGQQYRFDEGGVCYSIDPRYVESDSLDFRGTCYVTPPTMGEWVRPGTLYELRVRTPAGEEMRGRTTVPGVFVWRSPRPFPSDDEVSCELPPNTALPLAWTRAQGAWSYVAQLRIAGLRDALAPQGVDAPNVLELTGLAVSEADTTILLPTEFGVFDRFEIDQDVLVAIQGGFPPRVDLDVVVAAADRNYVNGVRGGSFNPSGPVRVSSIAGDGVGVFGSLVPITGRIRVRTGAVNLCQVVR